MAAQNSIKQKIRTLKSVLRNERTQTILADLSKELSLDFYVCDRDGAVLFGKEKALEFEFPIVEGDNEFALVRSNGKQGGIIANLLSSLVQKDLELPGYNFRTALNGVLYQEKDNITDSRVDLKMATELQPSAEEVDDLLFASKICKHTKSNTIVLAKNRQLLASGTGQTSRVDALNQSVAKAGHFGFSLAGAVMASDAFFPFPDCVEIADKAGIKAVIQPGGSIKDQLSIDYCNEHEMAMVFTGTRHFKH